MRVYVQGHFVGEGIVGKFIGWFNWGNKKHVSMVFVGNGNVSSQFESTSKNGVHFSRYQKSDKCQLYYVIASEQQKLNMLEEARKLAGAKYDHAGIWGFVRRKKKQNPDKWFCSELVAHVLKVGGVELHRLPSWKQSPTLVCASVVIKPVREISDYEIK
jgi:hypothetical protein